MCRKEGTDELTQVHAEHQHCSNLSRESGSPGGLVQPQLVSGLGGARGARK